MSRLADAVRDWTEGISCPWASLAAKVVVRPGGLVLVIGAPGALKSMFALNWALSMSAPSLYLTLDTSKQMQAVRVISNETGHSLHQVYSDMDDSGRRPDWVTWLEGFDEGSFMKMTSTPVTPVEVGDTVSAWTEYWGEVPVMTIVDDISKMKGVRDYQDYDEAVIELGRVAKKRNAVIMGIQHVNRDGEDATKRPRLRAMKYTGEYEAAYVLGLWRPQPMVLRVSVLKNRTGEDDPNGNVYAALHADAPHVLIREQTHAESLAPPTRSMA